jgi:hypothetical protein
METATVLTLKPNVTREQAIRIFSSGASARLWQVRAGALRRVAEAYVPYWMYRVEYNMAGALQSRLFAMDAATGTLDLFRFPELPNAGQLAEIFSRNSLPAKLTPERAEEFLREKVLRVIFLQGFFKLRGAKINVTRIGGEFHIPYWLGFYGNTGVAHCRVLDALRRRIEGAKATALFEQWLAAA